MTPFARPVALAVALLAGPVLAQTPAEMRAYRTGFLSHAMSQCRGSCNASGGGAICEELCACVQDEMAETLTDDEVRTQMSEVRGAAAAGSTAKEIWVKLMEARADATKQLLARCLAQVR